jgi:hypothetical protein
MVGGVDASELPGPCRSRGRAVSIPANAASASLASASIVLDTVGSGRKRIREEEKLMALL